MRKFIRTAFKSVALATLATALMLGGWGAVTASAQTITPMPIPPGKNFPLPQATIDSWIATNNTAAIRNHAWDLWGGLAAPSGESFNGAPLPIWETWNGTEDLFPASGQTTTALTERVGQRPLRLFEVPLQFHRKAGNLTAALLAQDPNFQVLSFNKFDPTEAAFITTPQPGPNGQTFAYNTQAGLLALNNAWPPGTTGQNRGVKEFPITAIELKPVFMLVKATGLTPQPLWQGPSGSTKPANPTPNTWTTCVLVDPQGSGAITPATPAQIASVAATKGPACATFLYGPLSLFYSFKMSAAEAAAFGRGAVVGDYAVLVAMHVNTKEIPFWTWQTFWWQPGADTPNGFPGDKKGQPAGLPEPWNNYATCASYAQTTTPSGSKMQICFNPYLETSPSIPAGITSNCMSCHGTSRVMANPPGQPYPPDYKKPINFFGNPTWFNAQTTHTDFSWALPDDSN